MIKAFSYDSLDEFEFFLKTNIIATFIEAIKAEDEKIQLYGLIRWAHKAMLSIGKNWLTNKEDYSDFLDSVKNEINKNLDIKKELKVNLRKQLEKAETKLSEFSETTFDTNNLFVETAAYTGSIGIGIIVFNSVKKYFESSYPILGIIATLLSGGIFRKWWNRSTDKKIEEEKRKFKRRAKLLELLYLKIKNLE